jgi:hypothetical protein
VVDVAASALGPAERSGIDQAEHFRQHLNAAAQRLFEELLFGRNQTILHQRRSQGSSHRFLAAGLVEKAEDAALVDGVDGRIHVSVTSEHDADSVRRLRLDFAQKLNAIHAGHSHVGNYDRIGTMLSREFEGLLATQGSLHQKLAAQAPPIPVKDVVIVVH